MNKTKLEKYMPMILAYRDKAKSLGCTNEAKLADELLKELKGQQESFNDSKLERLNYALYKRDKVVKINKYITEDVEPLRQAYIDATNGEDILVVSGTGTGKAYASNEILKKEKFPILNLLPNTLLTEQQGKNYNIMSSFGKIKDDETRSLDYCLEHSNIVGATWNKLSDLSRNTALLEANKAELKKRLLFIDEAHEQYSNGFRADRAEDVRKLSESDIFKGVLSATATPTRLDLSKYTKIIEYVSDENIKYNVMIYDTVSDDFIINEINDNVKGRFAIFRDNIEDLVFYQSRIKHKTDVIHANNKEESQAYKNILKRETFGKFKGVLHTSTMVAGVNIKDEDVTDIFIIGVKDPSKIRQICARYREVKELNVHILNKYNKEQKDFCYIENRIAYILDKTYKQVLELNQDIINMGVSYVVGANEYRFKANDDIYFDAITNRYRVNEASIRTNVYDYYYEERSREQFEELLKEYFTNVSLVNLNVEKEDKKAKAEFIEKLNKEAKEMLDRLEPYRETLILCNRLCKGLKLNKDQEEFVNKNYPDLEIVKGAYEFLKINELLDNIFFQKHNIRYSDLVVDRHFDNDIAWKLALLTEDETKMIDRKIKMLNYMHQRETDYDNMMKKAKMLIEHQRIEYVLGLDLENTWLNKEHFAIILEEYKKLNKKDMSVKSVHLKAIIEDMYNVIRTDAKPDSNFYKGVVPDFKGKKTIKAYNCKEKTTPQDVASIIGVEEDNPTLAKLIVGERSL